ncbi:hypothetical protein BOX15_Mlig011793g2, partial [Macrostomum lignano]
SRTEALEEAAEAAIAESGGSRQVEKLLALSYSEFGSMAKVQPFNRLLANNTDNFVPLVLSLLGADSRHLADFRELAFPELANGTGPEGWRLHKLAHWPKDGRSSGTKLSCLLVAPAGRPATTWCWSSPPRRQCRSATATCCWPRPSWPSSWAGRTGGSRAWPESDTRPACPSPIWTV